jgi:hypothetical protein
MGLGGGTYVEVHMWRYICGGTYVEVHMFSKNLGATSKYCRKAATKDVSK